MPTQSEVLYPETPSFQAPEARSQSCSLEDPVNKANIWRAARKYIRFIPILAILAVSACSSVDGATTPAMMLTGTEGADATEMVPLPTPSATPEIPSPTVNKPIEASPTPTATVKPTETPPPTPTKTEVPPSSTPTEIPKDWAKQYFLEKIPEGAINIGLVAAKDRKNIVVNKEGEAYVSCSLKTDVKKLVQDEKYLVGIKIDLDEPNGNVCWWLWGTKATLVDGIASNFSGLSQAKQADLLERNLALSEAMMDAILALPYDNPYLDAATRFGLCKHGNTANWMVWTVPNPVPDGYEYQYEVLTIPFPPPTPTQ